MAGFGRQDLVQLFGAEAKEDVVRLKNDKKDGVAAFQPKLVPAKRVSRLRAGVEPSWAASTAAAPAGGPAGAAVAANTAPAQPGVAAYESEEEGDKGVEEYHSDSSAGGAASPARDSDSDSSAAAEALAQARARARARARAGAHTAPAAADALEAALAASAAAPAVTMVRTAAPVSGSGSDSDADVARRGAPSPPRDSASSSEDSSSEDSSSEEEEEEAAPVLMKPLFVPRGARSTIKTEEQEAAEAAAAAAAAEAEAAARVEATRAAVATLAAAEEAEAAAGEGSEEEMPSDGDHSSEEEADVEAWKLRELGRLQRELDAVAAAAEEAAATAARRRMTPAERAADDARLEAAGLRAGKKEKGGRGFMQRHYHKGAFYMDEESLATPGDVRLRDNESAATGADKVDKRLLPKVMQVKDFGRRGRSKWTHLAAEDTTFAAGAGHGFGASARGVGAPTGAGDGGGDRERQRRGEGGMWFAGGGALASRTVAAMGGMGDDLDRAGRVTRGDRARGAASSGRERDARPASRYR